MVRATGGSRQEAIPLTTPRLGVIEQQLDAMTGQRGVIGQVAAQVIPRGKVEGTARRSMTMAAAIRAVLLMALMPEKAGCGEILSALFGDLALLPWHVPFAVPTDTVLATWRNRRARSPAPAAAGHGACRADLKDAGILRRRLRLFHGHHFGDNGKPDLTPGRCQQFQPFPAEALEGVGRRPGLEHAATST